MKSLSGVRLFATLWTVAYQAVWSMGFSRQEYWSGLPFPSPGDLPNPGIEPGSPALQTDTLPSEPPGLLTTTTAAKIIKTDYTKYWQESVCLQCRRPGFNFRVGKIPWRRKWQSTPALLPGKSHGQRSLIGYSPQGRKESDTTERLHFHYGRTRTLMEM